MTRDTLGRIRMTERMILGNEALMDQFDHLQSLSSAPSDGRSVDSRTPQTEMKRWRLGVLEKVGNHVKLLHIILYWTVFHTLTKPDVMKVFFIEYVYLNPRAVQQLNLKLSSLYACCRPDG